MANKVEVELNSNGVRELLKSNEMQRILEDYASQIAKGAGEGYSYDTKIMGTRAVASAYADTVDAMRNEFNNNSLIKAMGAVQQ